jgi:mannose-1-phosphate guanylyltransferase
MTPEGIKPNFVFKVSQFKEKPDQETAEKFIASGKYLWNTGLYCWSTESIKSAFEKYAPNLAEAFNKILHTAQPLQAQFLIDLFNDVGNPDTIDYEISEKADNIIAVSGEFGWSDVGDWKVVDEYKQKDNQGNAVVNGTADCVMIKAENNLVDSNGKMIAVVGLSNIVVIETENAILVCNKDNSQDVKKVVEKLKEEKKGQYL